MDLVTSIRVAHHIEDLERMTLGKFISILNSFPEYSFYLKRSWMGSPYDGRQVTGVNILTAMLARRLNADGISAARMAIWLGVSESSISSILRGEHYRDVPGLQDKYINEHPGGFYFVESMDLRAFIKNHFQ